jgi:hypothetical protein
MTVLLQSRKRQQRETRPMSTCNQPLIIDVIQALFRDEGHLAKLRQLGMTSTEEAKLVSMRDYIVKLANAVSRFDQFSICV